MLLHKFSHVHVRWGGAGLPKQCQLILERGQNACADHSRSVCRLARFAFYWREDDCSFGVFLSDNSCTPIVNCEAFIYFFYVL